MLEQVGLLLLGAIVALALREAWEWHTARRDRRKRDRQLVTALMRELFYVNGVGAAIVRDINRERSLLNENRWRLKPFMLLPTNLSDIVRTDTPEALLAHEDILLQIASLDVQCQFFNQVAAEQRVWKSPAARDTSDQLQVIADFHAPLAEAITAVNERTNRLIVTVNEIADARYDGLDMKRREPPQDAETLQNGG